MSDLHLENGRPHTLFHLFVFTSLFVPLACIPYIPIRNRLVDLRRSIHVLSINTSALQHELSTTLLQARLRQEESLKLTEQLRALQTQLDSATKRAREADSARLTAEKALSERLDAAAEWTAQRETDRLKAYGELGRQLDAMERRAERDRLPPVVLHDVSTSLADIASFIEEVEIHQGLDQSIPRDRGIHRMRQLALKLHAMSSAKPSNDA